MIEDIFVINARGENEVLFYGQVEAGEEVENLPSLLSTVIQYAKQLDLEGAPFRAKSVQLSQGRFVYGTNGLVFIVCKVNTKDPVDAMMELAGEVAAKFASEHSKQLEEFSGDVSQFSGFSQSVAKVVAEFKEKQRATKPAKLAKPSLPRISVPAAKRPVTTPLIKPRPKLLKHQAASKAAPAVATPAAPSPAKRVESVAAGATEKVEKVPSVASDGGSPAKASDFLRAPEPIKVDATPLPEKREGPPFPPMKRRAFPSGKLDEFERDEVLWNESQDVMQNYTAEFVDGIISKLKVFLSISIQHHYEVVVDFSNYPDKPTIALPEGLREDLGKPVEDLMYFTKNWDPTLPAHVVEVVRELEAFLLGLKSKGKLTPTAQLDASMIPDLEPLEELPPLTPEEEKLLKKYEEEKKKKERETTTAKAVSPAKIAAGSGKPAGIKPGGIPGKPPAPPTPPEAKTPPSTGEKKGKQKKEKTKKKAKKEKKEKKKGKDK